LLLEPFAPLPPENFTSPTELLAEPPEAPVALFVTAELPPLAITVIALMKCESPPAEVLVLPAPTTTA
jgi:hypothetical protein